MKACVVGHPVSHSLSPKVFAFLSEKLGKRVAYSAFDVPPQDLSMQFDKAKKEFLGWNVTLPHKESILELLDDVSATAQRVGAVNAIHFNNGKALGENFDVHGVTQALQGQGFSKEIALIYGAGGAARAACEALGQMQFEAVYLVNRDEDKARRVAETFDDAFEDTEYLEFSSSEEIHDPISLAINATSVGMQGEHFVFPPPAQLATDATAFDMIYSREITPFLKLFSGINRINGVGMLAAQATATWEFWLGDSVDPRLQTELVEYLRKLVEEA